MLKWMNKVTIFKFITGLKVPKSNLLLNFKNSYRSIWDSKLKLKISEINNESSNLTYHNFENYSKTNQLKSQPQTSQSVLVIS